MIAAGQPGRAMLSFLTEIIGLSAAEVAALRDAPRGYDVMPIVSATMPRESKALGTVDLSALAAGSGSPCCSSSGRPARRGRGTSPGSWPRC